MGKYMDKGDGRIVRVEEVEVDIAQLISERDEAETTLGFQLDRAAATQARVEALNRKISDIKMDLQGIDAIFEPKERVQ